VTVTTPDGWAIVADEPLQGPSEIVESSPFASPEDLTVELRAAARANKIAEPGDRGGGEIWRSIIDAIRGRRVRSVEGPYEVPVSWLAFHVPPHGAGQLTVTTSSSSEYGLQLKAVGTGWGSGRSMKVNVSRDYHDRHQCFGIEIALSVRCTLYEDGSPSRTDVLSVAGQTVHEFRPCPFCGAMSESAGRIERPAGAWLDLTADSVGQVVEETIDIVDKNSFEASVPFKPPGIDTEIGVTWTRENNLTCQTRYTFPGGRRYRPYRELGRPVELPYWRWE
jgi:hypothetical protein